MVLAVVFRKIRIVLLPLFCCVISNLAISNERRPSQNAQQQVVVFTNDWSPLITVYFKSVMKRAIHRAEKYDGQYAIKFQKKGLSPTRIRQIAADNSFLYFDFSTDDTAIRAPDPITHNLRSSYKMPLLKGILGLRRVIVKRSEKRRYQAINQAENFRKLQAGQVNFWPDVAIYETAGIRVKKALSYKDLFPMLHAGRFDYLPLGIIEVHGALQDQKAYISEFYIPEDIYIYYSIPVYVNVLRQAEHTSVDIINELYEMIEYGELDDIFLKHFGEYIESISTPSAKVFVLENPEESTEHNQTAINKALELYFNNSAQVFYPGSVN